MPYGISWPQYFIRASVVMLSMFTGAQIVHMIYKPLDDLEELIEAEKRRRILKASPTQVKENGIS